MKLVIVVGSIIGPLIMLMINRKDSRIRFLIDWIAILSALILGNIAAVSIYQIIKDETVFMTNIHGIFLNPFFLITGAYLGAYGIYILVLHTINRWKSS